MELDTEKIEQAVLALLALGTHDDQRAWKSFDWDAMRRLRDKGYISNSSGRSKSVSFTEDGARESERLLRGFFAAGSDRTSWLSSNEAPSL